MISRNLIALVLAGASALAQAPAVSTIPSNDDIRKILADRVGAENSGIGIVVGVIEPKGRRVVAYGTLAKDDKRPLNGDTVFEIGSITKVFTSLILMDMVQKGEVAVTDPVAKYLPATVKVPERNGKKITLQDLATQSSGLPRMPSNFHPKDDKNPYADYTPEQLYEFLSGYELSRDIGSQFEYSNLGVGLLGHALTLRAGTDYESLVKARVLAPLDMNSTRVTLSPEMKARLAVGHGPQLDAVANWDIATLTGAGALRSTANDMLTFLAANLGYKKTSLASAMADQVSIRRSAGAPDMQIAYNWLIQSKNGNSIIWHNGGTGGYRTYIGFDPKARTGVVVLSNVSTPQGPDDIGRHLLDAGYPLLKMEAPKERKQITVDTRIYDKYIGSYQFGPGAIFTVTREGDRLLTQLTGQGKVEVFPEAPDRFFAKVVDAQISFDADAQGNTTQLVLHQNGLDQPAKRISDAEVKQATDAVAARTAAITQRYKDQKQAPGSEAAVRRDIEEIRAGQPKYELMSSGLAVATKQQLPQMQASFSQLGPVQTVTFKGVGPGGADIYEVQFEHGKLESRISMGADGKIEGISFRPL